MPSLKLDFAAKRSAVYAVLFLAGDLFGTTALLRYFPNVGRLLLGYTQQLQTESTVQAAFFLFYRQALFQIGVLLLLAFCAFGELGTAVWFMGKGAILGGSAAVLLQYEGARALLPYGLSIMFPGIVELLCGLCLAESTGKISRRLLNALVEPIHPGYSIGRCLMHLCRCCLAVLLCSIAGCMAGALFTALLATLC